MANDPGPCSELSDSREKDQVFRALSKQRRRSTLRILEREQAATIAEIAAEIAARQDEEASTDDRSDVVTAVRADLYHHHVPVLADAGLVHYAEHRDVVALSEHGTNVTATLEGGSL